MRACNVPPMPQAHTSAISEAAIKIRRNLKTHCESAHTRALSISKSAHCDASRSTSLADVECR